MNSDVCAFYSKWSPYNIYRQNAERPDAAGDFVPVLKNVIDALQPNKLMEATAPAWFEIGLRRGDDGMFVQLLNRARAYHVNDRPASDIVVTLRAANKPAEVVLQPGSEAVQWSWNDGQLVFRLSSEQVPVHRIVVIR
jgi:hypothetical protein